MNLEALGGISRCSSLREILDRRDSFYHEHTGNREWEKIVIHHRGPGDDHNIIINKIRVNGDDSKLHPYSTQCLAMKKQDQPTALFMPCLQSKFSMRMSSRCSRTGRSHS